jgi:hypothetical protein
VTDVTEQTGLAAADAAEEAVGRLGTASAARRAEASGAPAARVDLARALSADVEFLGAIPSYARIHSGLTAALDAALDAIWPRSSPQRPGPPAAVADRCRAIARVLEAPEAAVARRIAELPPGDAGERLLAEGRQALLLDGRLAAAGLRADDLDATPVGRAARDLDALFRDHRIQSREAAGEALDALRLLCGGLAPLAPALARLADLAGLPEATASQVAMMAKCLAVAPSPWPGTADPTAAARGLADELAEEVVARSAAAEAARRLDDAHGPAWRGEEPGKLEAAARILADPADLRASKALAYATSLGCPDVVDAAGPTLSGMARAKLQLRRNWPPACMSRVAPLVPAAIAHDPEASLAYLRSAEAWHGEATRTETLRRLCGALDGLPLDERDGLVASASPLLAALQAIPPERRRGPAAAMAAAMGAEVASLERHAAALSVHSTEDCESARRPSIHLRERRGCLERLVQEDLYASLGLGRPEELPAALAWAEAARSELPEGVDPFGRHAAALLARAIGSVGAAVEVMRMEEEARVRTGTSDPADLVAAGRLALSEIRLSEARAAVESAGAWAHVAWLDAEGIEPELWGEALASRRVAEAQARAEESPSHAPVPVPVAAARPVPLFEPTPGLAWRRLRAA